MNESSAIDYRMPITVFVMAKHPVTHEFRKVKVDILWEHVLSIEEEPFPEQFPPAINGDGITNMRLVYAVYAVSGSFIEYHRAWCTYKHYMIKKALEYKFNLPAN